MLISEKEVGNAGFGKPQTSTTTASVHLLPLAGKDLFGPLDVRSDVGSDDQENARLWDVTRALQLGS